jgi:hypothetical protein
MEVNHMDKRFVEDVLEMLGEVPTGQIVARIKSQGARSNVSVPLLMGRLAFAAQCASQDLPSSYQRMHGALDLIMALGGSAEMPATY